ncbi:MAG: ELM1/GtrOC1 family putative glycosyltransferase [Desulfuromusa sp.]|nr:ELM1/GtrOC1 family putative glycosyltransferase [Desulfuromusa sp.]
MKLNPANVSVDKTRRLLILSDGKPGHVNQSIAFSRHLDYEYDLNSISFKNRGWKVLSYLFDWMGVHTPNLFTADTQSGEYTAVVSAGSGTYYANRTLAKQLGCKSVAIMLPKGYRLDFDLIVAQQHDNPPPLANIISIPINLTYVEPQGIVKPQFDNKYIALIIGGDSQYSQMDSALLRDQISKILALFPTHKVWMTTSRRTPKNVEKMLHEFHFEREIFYSQEPINPLPDYLQHSDYVFLTADSSSMISESVSFGQCCVEVLPLPGKLPAKNKFNRLIKTLSEMNCLHIFDGSCGVCNNKISLVDVFQQPIVARL